MVVVAVAVVVVVVVGGGGDRCSSNGKGREEGTGQIFLMFAAEGVDFESVAGADQRRYGVLEKEGEGKKERGYFGGLRRTDL